MDPMRKSKYHLMVYLGLLHMYRVLKDKLFDNSVFYTSIIWMDYYNDGICFTQIKE